MSMATIRSKHQNRSVHQAHFDEDELKKMAVEAVAAQLGIDPTADHIHVHAVATTYMEGSLGTRRARIEVEIIDNHEGKPREGVEHVANGTLSPSITGDGSGQPLPSIDPA